MGFWKGLGYLGGGVIAIAAAPILAPFAAAVAAEAAVVAACGVAATALTAKGVSEIDRS